MNLSRTGTLITLFLLAFASILLSLLKGSTAVQLNQLYNPTNTLAHEIIFNIRLPRTCCAFVTGALLALAGALMQALLRNPLADPYVLGTSGGAAVATLLLIFLGISGPKLTLGAWMGSLAAILLVLALAERKKTWNSEHLILIGIALASGFSAVMSLILLISPEHMLRGMLFWLVGDFGDANMPFFEMGLLLVGLTLSILMAKELNILVRGEKEARALGIHVTRLKIKLFLLSSILTATAVTLAGCIGFIGLIIPHLFRLLCGYDHRYLLPGCALLGGTLLTIADTLSRSLFAPQQIPVGIIMVLIGIPIFLFLLQKK
jgi:iron complex transport system permease protein